MVEGKDNANSEEPEDENNPLPEGLSDQEQLKSGTRSRRKRIKVRKRIRIKKKISPQKKAKKLIETVIWIISILAFVATLIMLVMQLELNSKNMPKKKSSNQKPVIDHFASKAPFYI